MTATPDRPDPWALLAELVHALEVDGLSRLGLLTEDYLDRARAALSSRGPEQARCANPYHQRSGCAGRERECYNLRPSPAPPAPPEPPRVPDEGLVCAECHHTRAVHVRPEFGAGCVGPDGRMGCDCPGWNPVAAPPSPEPEPESEPAVPEETEETERGWGRGHPLALKAALHATLPASPPSPEPEPEPVTLSEEVGRALDKYRVACISWGACREPHECNLKHDTHTPRLALEASILAWGRALRGDHHE